MNTNLCKIQMNINSYSNSTTTVHREIKTWIHMISFFFFSSAHHLLQKQLRTYGIAHFLVKHDIWAASLNIASCLFVLMAQ